MNERDVTALLERRAATVPTSDPPIDELIEAARRDHAGGHRHRRAIVAAASVLALIIGAGIAWDSARDDAAPPSRPVEEPLPVHEGYRWVGMNGIAFEVPAAWTTSDSFCAPETADTVVFGYPEGGICQDSRVDPKASSLHFETLDSRNFIAEMAPARAQHQVSIGGLPALLTDPIELNCPQPIPDGCTSVLGSSVEIDSPDAHFLLVWIESPDRATVATTMGSISAIPDGYAAVPSTSGQPQSKAAHLIGSVGLDPEARCPGGGQVCDGALRVSRTDPQAGSIVPLGTQVTMVMTSAATTMPVLPQ